MYVDENERQTLKVIGGETQKVELTSETFQDDVFDHYLVVKNPTVSHLFFLNFILGLSFCARKDGRRLRTAIDGIRTKHRENASHFNFPDQKNNPINY